MVRLVILCVVLFALGVLAIARTSATSVNIVNNSNRAIVNVYLSHVGADDWGGNQLGNSTIAPGGSFSLNNVAWDQQQVKIIAEDQDGCFESAVVTCDTNSSWTITSDTARDCGQ